MKKKIIIPTVIAVALVVGFIMGKSYQVFKLQNEIEDLISKEVAISLKYQDVPPCNKVVAEPNKFTINEVADTYIAWKYNSESKTLQKVIIDADFNVVVDEYAISHQDDDSCTISTK